MSKKIKLKEVPLIKIAEELITKYGMHTIQERALPDYRDGLKPVHRRILYAMFKMGLKASGPFRKSATVVGEVIGAYHPHGDTAIYDSMVTMANLPVKLIDGQGSWGLPYEGDKAAAYRYTECKLTPYAESRIVHPDYMVLAKLHPNYNNETTEPLFIPAIVPNLFLNGTYGIATGATGIMPPFHPDGIFRLVERAIKGESITAKACVKNLRLNYPNGGTFACDEDYLRGFFKTGRAGLPLQVDYELDLKKRLIIITGAPFGVTVEKVVKRLSENKHVAANGIQNFINGDHPINTFIRLKNTISEKEVSGIAEELCRKLNYTLAANVAITERIDEEKGNFEETNLPNLIGEWAKYRIQLERDVQDAKIAVLDKKVADNELFILAASKLDAVFQALKSTNTKQVLMEKLRIKEEQAARIMAMTVGSLSRLSKDKCQKEIEQWNKDKKSALKIKKEPNARVMELMNIAA